MAGMWIVGEDMPQETNRVTLHADREGPVRPADPQRPLRRPSERHRDAQPRLPPGHRGLPGGRCDRRLRDPALSQHPQSGHQPDERAARDGVVNKHGQTHDIKNLFISDGSQFTTGGAENPTLTIVTLAIRQADYIADQMSKKEI